MPITIAETGAQWIVIASICDCGHVALTIASADTLDPNASADAEHDEEVVVCGDDWRQLAITAAMTLHTATGHPISAMCTVVDTKDRDEWRARGMCSPFEEEVTAFMYAELDTRNTR